MSIFSDSKDSMTHKLEVGVLAAAFFITPAAFYLGGKAFSKPGEEPAAVKAVDNIFADLKHATFPNYTSTLKRATTTTVDEILANHTEWIGKSVAIEGDVKLTKNESSQYSRSEFDGPPRYSSKKPCYYLDITHRYDMKTAHGTIELIYDHNYRKGFESGKMEATDSIKHFGPETGQQIIVGTVKEYKGGKGVYIAIDNQSFASSVDICKK